MGHTLCMMIRLQDTAIKLSAQIALSLPTVGRQPHIHTFDSRNLNEPSPRLVFTHPHKGIDSIRESNCINAAATVPRGPSNRFLYGLNWQLFSITFFVQKMALLVEALNILLIGIWSL